MGSRSSVSGPQSVPFLLLISALFPKPPRHPPYPLSPEPRRPSDRALALLEVQVGARKRGITAGNCPECGTAVIWKLPFRERLSPGCQRAESAAFAREPFTSRGLPPPRGLPSQALHNESNTRGAPLFPLAEFLATFPHSCPPGGTDPFASLNREHTRAVTRGHSWEHVRLAPHFSEIFRTVSGWCG